jgi:hypothetical protein
MTVSPPPSTSGWTAPAGAEIVGTRADREALFDYLVEATRRRQAISPSKNAIFAIDVDRDMGRWRRDLVEAETPAALWYALVKLSNTRHDRHLSVRPVEGGLPVPPELVARMAFNYAEMHNSPAPRAPVSLATDFSDPDKPTLFLAGLSDGYGAGSGIAPGDLLVAVNGQPVADYVAAVEPYFCHSTPAFFWYHLPSEIVRRTALLPAHFHQETLRLAFSRTGGSVAEIALPWLPADAVADPAPQADPYAGFTRAISNSSCHVWLDAARSVLLLDWRGFGKTLVADVDQLMACCEADGLLDLPVIFDATRCRGGDYGGYLLQRLSPRPFRINFGDLRISDAIPQIIADVTAEDEADLASGRLSPGQIEAIGWRRAWLEEDIRAAYAHGLSVSRAVPFKCAHQPRTGDGWLAPAPVHFSGPLVCLTMPFGGSHIDQVMAQLNDNNLCHQIGMPLGGYSKTYVLEETLRLPLSGIPLASFMWACGNTIRPNGEVLESNPAMPHERVPVTRANYARHHRLLVARALEAIATRTAERPRKAR